MKALLNYRFHFLIFIFCFILYSKFNVDPDLGWHLAIGEHFLKTGEVLRLDTFSWTIPGYNWGNSYFAYEVLAAFLIGNLGFLFTQILFGFLGALAVQFLLPKKLNLVTFLMTCLGASVASVNMAIRPHTISFLMFCLLLFFLKRGFCKTKLHFLFWGVFFLIWANIHNSFLIGLGFFAMHILIGSFFDKKTKSKKQIIKIGAFLAFPILLTLVTPFGWRLWHAVLNDALFLDMYFWIEEWQSIAALPFGNVFYAMTGGIFIWFFHKNFNKVPVQWLLLGCFFFILPFLGIYFAFFWAAVFIFLITNFAVDQFDVKGSFVAKFPVYFSLLAGFLALLLNFALEITTFDKMENLLKVNGYPVEAAYYIKQTGLLKNLYNDYGWGGYLVWSVPGQKLFMDGRMTGWRTNEGTYILKDYLDIYAGSCDLVSKYQIKSVLLKKSKDWKCEAGFKEVYSDATARILIRE